MSDIPKVPEKIGYHVMSKQLKKSVASSLMKNRSLNRSKRASLDAGKPFINEAELVKNYFDMKGKITE